MRVNRYNRGGRTALYDMVKRYADGGIHNGDPKKEENNVRINQRLRKPVFGKKVKLEDSGGKEYGSIKYRGLLARMLSQSDVRARFEDGGIHNGDPKKAESNGSTVRVVRNNFDLEPTIESSYRDNEGMQEAQSPGSIDAYNFTVPESGLLEDLDDATKASLRGSPFGADYFSGEGSLDEQYNAYSAKAVKYMSENPDQALSAINEMIESGNKNFQGLKDKSDQEKLEMATSYMTDKKIGDFHGAFTFGEKLVPRVTGYDSTSSNIRGPKREHTVISLGDKAIKEGDVINFRKAAEKSGIDVTSDSPEAREFLTSYMNEFGYMDFREGRGSGKDNYQYIEQAKEALAETDKGYASAAEKRTQGAYAKILADQAAAKAQSNLRAQQARDRHQ